MHSFAVAVPAASKKAFCRNVLRDGVWGGMIRVMVMPLSGMEQCLRKDCRRLSERVNKCLTGIYGPLNVLSSFLSRNKRLPTRDSPATTLGFAIPGWRRTQEVPGRSFLWRARDELRYYPNTWARTLVPRRSRIVGLIVSEISNPFFSEFIQRFSTRAVQ